MQNPRSSANRVHAAMVEGSMSIDVAPLHMMVGYDYALLR
jgi:hypothetical protein